MLSWVTLVRSLTIPVCHSFTCKSGILIACCKTVYSAWQLGLNHVNYYHTKLESILFFLVFKRQTGLKPALENHLAQYIVPWTDVPTETPLFLHIMHVQRQKTHFRGRNSTKIMRLRLYDIYRVLSLCRVRITRITFERGKFNSKR